MIHQPQTSFLSSLFKYSLGRVFIAILFVMGAFYALPLQAQVDLMSVTLDNDFFVNEDNGYTNGLFVSSYEVDDTPSSSADPNVLVKPFMWSMPNGFSLTRIKVHSISQTLMTPNDLTQTNPPEGTFPYAGLLTYTNTYISVSADHADKISTTLGVVGPLALGKQTQKAIHKIISAQDPKGWDTQLKNEPVFMISRSRNWRTWVSDDGKMDLLMGGGVSVGTIRSSVDTGVIWRYGSRMENSFASVLLSRDRISNPIAIDHGWFVFAGALFSYDFNQIIMDGNTFRDSRSIDYDHAISTFSTGLSYSWGETSLAFAINTPFSINGNDGDREIDKYLRYGTLTFAWTL
ncbi:lipid A deacylase LpxR family protein [Marinomonas sp. THO17]|uniref:lipid A deacylase LpxR family protein n=1 Tax=Marinomonas sp. THO17 TaxID=3149048 RepID=UPI00336C1443